MPWEFVEVNEKEKSKGHWEIVEEEKERKALNSLGVGLPEEKNTPTPETQNEISVLNSLGVGLPRTRGHWEFQPVKEKQKPGSGWHWQIVEEPTKINFPQIALETLKETWKELTARKPKTEKEILSSMGVGLPEAETATIKVPGIPEIAPSTPEQLAQEMGRGGPEVVLRPKELKPEALVGPPLPEWQQKPKFPRGTEMRAMTPSEKQQFEEATTKEWQEYKPDKELWSKIYVDTNDKLAKALDVPGQFAQNFVNGLLLNLPEFLSEKITGVGMPRAKSAAGELAGGIGHLAGMIKGPFKVTHNLFTFGKPAETVFGQGFQNLLRTSATLGAVSFASEHRGDGLKENILNRLNAGLGGAVIGAVFGASDLAFLNQTPVLGTVLRFGMNSALLDFINGNTPFDERSLTEKAFDYGLNLWFSKEGVKLSRLAELEREVDLVNKQLAKDKADIELPKEKANEVKEQVETTQDIKFVGESKQKVLNPKEQKAWLVKEVDEAIGKAPDLIWDEKTSTFKKTAEALNAIVFDVPGDGQFEIFNNKPALEKFKTSLRNWPVQPLRQRIPGLPSIKQPTRKALLETLGEQPELNEWLTAASNRLEEKLGRKLTEEEHQNLLEQAEKIKYPEAQKPSESFYAYREEAGKPGTRRYIEVPGEKVDIADWLDTFIYKDESGNWKVTESKTGLSIASGGSKAGAIQDAVEAIKEKGREETERTIKGAIEAQGLSPRFRKTETRHIATTVEELEARAKLLEEGVKKGATAPPVTEKGTIRAFIQDKTPEEQLELLTKRRDELSKIDRETLPLEQLREFDDERSAVDSLLSELQEKGRVLPLEEPTGTKTVDEINRLEKEAKEKEKGTLPGIGLSIEQQTGPKVKGKFEFKDKEIEKRFELAKGIPKKTLPQRFVESFISLKNKATRTYESLPNKAQFVEAKTALKTLAKQPAVTSYKTLRILHDVSMDLDKESLNLFRRKVILNDLYQEARKGKELPFGFKAESVIDELKRIDTAIEGIPEIKDALAKRDRIWKAVKDDYIFWADKAGFEVEDRLKRVDYYRHQVLEYARAKGVATTGKRLRTPTGRGFLKGRAGSEFDINTDYFEAEHEILGQMLYDTEIMKTIDRLRKNYDISEKVKKEAKEKKLLDWRENVPQGYAAWQPREGNVFYQADTIPARVAEQILEGELTDLDVVKEKLNKSLAVGQKRAEWVIPTELAKTLDNLKGERPNWLTRLSAKVLRGWKIWTLTSPRRVFKYNIRNLTGDADAVFVGNPSAFKKVPTAMKELYDALVLNRPMSENMKTWFDRGGVETTLQAQELGDVKGLRLFQRFYDQKGNLKDIPEKTWKAYWKTARLGTDFRESILRYASFIDYKEQILSNTEGRPRNFGGSLPQEIMALKDVNDKAFRLSNELLGPYDEISELGQVIRKHIFPFWSWQELNFKRYVRFFKNAARDNAVCSAVGRKLLATGLKTPYLILRTGRFAIKAAAFWGMLQAYNHLRFPDEENELPAEVRGRPHIVFGRGKDGKIKYFSRVGALGDFLDWFGLDDLPNKVSNLVNGKKSLKDIAIEMAESPVNKFAQGINPFLKTPMELITRRAIFPDISNPKTIRDRGEYLAKTLGLENEYREIMGKPAKPYAESLPQALIYESDPLESAYYEIQDKKREFLKKFGKAGEGFWLSPRGNALFNMKLAHRYKDKIASEKYLKQYLHYHALEFEAGTKNEKELAKSVERGIIQAIFSMYPLYGLSTKEQVKFITGLNEDEKKTLAKALRFYTETLIGATNTEQK